MPNNYVKKVANETGESEDKLEKLWDDAKEVAKKEGKKEGNKDFYPYVMGIFQHMVGLKENEIFSYDEFLESNLSANDFIEKLTE